MAGIFSKAELRRQLSAERKALLPTERHARSLAAEAHLAGAEVFRTAQTVALYRPLGGEVETEALVAAALAAGKRVVFPSVGAEEQMRWLRLGSAGFTTHHLGFEEPADGATVPLSAIELVVLPGLAFDAAGGRLGRGRGHYDRALAARPASLVTVGLGFGFQVVEAIPTEPHDIALDWIASESGLVRCLH